MCGRGCVWGDRCCMPANWPLIIRALVSVAHSTPRNQQILSSCWRDFPNRHVLDERVLDKHVLVVWFTGPRCVTASSSKHATQGELGEMVAHVATD